MEEEIRRINELQKLIETFRLERITYLILTVLSAISLFGIGLFFILVESDTEKFLALLLPTGTLTLCIFRVLKMWDDAIRYMSNTPNT